MNTLENKTVVVAGGTGNVGSFIVKDLLQRGASVAVPSRSEEKLSGLEAHLKKSVDRAALNNLNTFVGNIGDEEGAEELMETIIDSEGTPDAAVASLGRFIPAPSLLDTTVNELQQVIDGYLTGHFVAARTFLGKFKEQGGTYVFINGPLALEPWEDSGTGLISVATAGQQMLFKAMAQELKKSPVRIVELMSHAFIRERQTQSSSPIPGESVGAYTSYLISDDAEDVHGKTIQLRSMEQLEQAGISIED